MLVTRSLGQTCTSLRWVTRLLKVDLPSRCFGQRFDSTFIKFCGLLFGMLHRRLHFTDNLIKRLWSECKALTRVHALVVTIWVIVQSSCYDCRLLRLDLLGEQSRHFWASCLLSMADVRLPAKVNSYLHCFKVLIFLLLWLAALLGLCHR